MEKRLDNFTTVEEILYAHKQESAIAEFTKMVISNVREWRAERIEFQGKKLGLLNNEIAEIVRQHAEEERKLGRTPEQHTTDLFKQLATVCKRLFPNGQFYVDEMQFIVRGEDNREQFMLSQTTPNTLGILSTPESQQQIAQILLVASAQGACIEEILGDRAGTAVFTVALGADTIALQSPIETKAYDGHVRVPRGCYGIFDSSKGAACVECSDCEHGCVVIQNLETGVFFFCAPKSGNQVLTDLTQTINELNGGDESKNRFSVLAPNEELFGRIKSILGESRTTNKEIHLYQDYKWNGTQRVLGGSSVYDGEAEKAARNANNYRLEKNLNGGSRVVAK